LRKRKYYNLILMAMAVCIFMIAGCGSTEEEEVVQNGTEGGEAVQVAAEGMSIFLEHPDTGLITDIRLGEFDGNPGEDIGFSGEAGFGTADRTGEVTFFVNVPPFTGWSVIVDIENDGLCEQLIRVTLFGNPALYDHSGNMVMDFDREIVASSPACGDIDGDGENEIIVPTLIEDGIMWMTGDGEELFSEGANRIWHAEVVDVDGDGTGEIVYCDGRGHLNVKTAAGEVKVEADPGGMNGPYVDNFSVINWPDKDGATHVVVAGGLKLWLIDMSVEIVRSVEIMETGEDDLFYNNACTAVLDEDGDLYVACLTENVTAGGLSLYIWGPDDSLYAEEQLDERSWGLCAVDLDGDGIDTILIGQENRIMRYDTE